MRTGFARALALASLCSAGATPAASIDPAPPAARAATLGDARIKLLPSRESGPVSSGDAAANRPRQPVSLAAADFDGDGFPDLAVGASGAGAGFLTLYRADAEAFAPSRPETLAGIRDGRFPDPFTTERAEFPLPVAPDFLLAGDFDRDGLPDLLVAARDGRALFLLVGDGRGGFSVPREIALPGGVTALASGPFDEGDGRVRVAVAVRAHGRAELLLFEGSANLVEQRPISRELPSEAAWLALGRLDDDRLGDLAILAGGVIIIRHGRDTTGLAHPSDDPLKGELEPLELPFTVTSFAIGDLIRDRDSRSEIAAAGADGIVRVLAHGELDTRPFEAREILALRRRTAPPAGVAANPAALSWRIAGQIGETAAFAAGDRPPVLTCLRLSSLPGDDLVIMEPAARRMRILHEDLSPGAVKPAPGAPAPRAGFAIDTAGAPLALLPMRLNVMAEPGLVVLREPDAEPSLYLFAPLTTFAVTKLADSNDGACNADCSLREAIVASNANGTGADLVTFNLNGTFLLSLSSAGGNENSAATGDLDINGSLTITGNGAANTVISTNYTNTCGDCKVFGVDQTGGFGGIAVAMSGLTVQNGYNNGAAYCGTFYETGGGIDFYLFGSGNTFSMTSCVIQNNRATGCAASHGGGVNVDSTNTATVGGPSAGSATFTGCTFTGNTTDREGGGLCLYGDKHDVTINGGTSMTGNQSTVSPGFGGGLSIAHTYGGTVMMTGGSVTNNTSAGAGGGIFIDYNPNVSLNNVTITGNTSVSSGTGSSVAGGIGINPLGIAGFTPTISVIACTISNNHANNGVAAQGGGVYFHSPDPVTLSNCTISGNTSKTGAGVYNGGSGSTPPAVLTINNGTAITGNIASGDGGGLIDASPTSVTSLSGVTIGGAGALANSALNGGGIANGDGTLSLVPANVTLGANTATGAGGLLYVSGGSLTLTGFSLTVGTAANGGAAAVSGGTLTLTKNTITGNSATTSGGALYQSGGTLNAGFNRIVNNTVGAGKSGLVKTAGTTAVDDNWWGCSTTPTAAPCDIVSGFAPANWLQLRHTASPNPVCTAAATTLTASFLTDSAGNAISTANLTTLIGRPISFGSAVLGALSGAQPNITAAGTATATYTAGATGGAGSAVATVDNGPTTAAITVNQPPGVATPPADQTVCAGSTASFGLTASGLPAPAVQWQQSTNGGGLWTDIGGATSVPYTFPVSVPQNGYQYRANLTNSCGTASSAAATLTVKTIPGAVGNTLRLVRSGGNLTLTWSDVAGAADFVVFEDPSSAGPFNTVTGSAATGATGLTIPLPAADNRYKVAARNSCGTGVKD